MIRPFTCLCLLLAGGSGLYLYQEKHRTQMLDREIGRVIHDTEASRARIGALKTEWAVRTEPGRLSDLAGRFLTLKPMAPGQFVQMAELAAHLPPVGPMPAAIAPVSDAPANVTAAPGNAPAASPDIASTDDDDAAPAADTTKTADATKTGDAKTGDAKTGDAGKPAAVPTAPPISEAASVQDVGDDGEVPAAAPTPAVAKVAKPQRRPAAMPIARTVDAGRPTNALAHGGLLPLAAARPMGLRVTQASARPGEGTRQIPPARRLQPQSLAYVGSSLGGGGAALPPPVPYSGE